ncbi:MAG: hypothetical protein AAFP26_09325 [Planctomycetota bacterium]
MSFFGCAETGGTALFNNCWQATLDNRGLYTPEDAFVTHNFADLTGPYRVCVTNTTMVLARTAPNGAVLTRGNVAVEFPISALRHCKRKEEDKASTELILEPGRGARIGVGVLRVEVADNFVLRDIYEKISLLLENPTANPGHHHQGHRSRTGSAGSQYGGGTTRAQCPPPRSIGLGSHTSSSRIRSNKQHHELDQRSTTTANQQRNIRSRCQSLPGPHHHAGHHHPHHPQAHDVVNQNMQGDLLNRTSSEGEKTMPARRRRPPLQSAGTRRYNLGSSPSSGVRSSSSMMSSLTNSSNSSNTSLSSEPTPAAPFFSAPADMLNTDGEKVPMEKVPPPPSVEPTSLKRNPQQRVQSSHVRAASFDGFFHYSPPADAGSSLSCSPDPHQQQQQQSSHNAATHEYINIRSTPSRSSQPPTPVSTSPKRGGGETNDGEYGAGPLLPHQVMALNHSNKQPAPASMKKTTTIQYFVQRFLSASGSSSSSPAPPSTPQQQPTPPPPDTSALSAAVAVPDGYVPMRPQTAAASVPSSKRYDARQPSSADDARHGRGAGWHHRDSQSWNDVKSAAKAPRSGGSTVTSHYSVNLHPGGKLIRGSGSGGDDDSTTGDDYLTMRAVKGALPSSSSSYNKDEYMKMSAGRPIMHRRSSATAKIGFEISRKLPPQYPHQQRHVSESYSTSSLDRRATVRASPPASSSGDYECMSGGRMTSVRTVPLTTRNESPNSREYVEVEVGKRASTARRSASYRSISNKNNR